MIRTRLFWKLFAGLACLSLLTASLVGLLALPGLVRGEERATERHLGARSRGSSTGVSRPVLAGGDDAALRRYVARRWPTATMCASP